MILYTKQGCPLCSVVKVKLNTFGIPYKNETNMEKMLAMGFKTLPILQLDDGTLLQFKEILNYIAEGKFNK